MKPGGISLRGWTLTIPVGPRTRLTHHVKCRTREPDVVFFECVEGWLGQYGEYRYADAEHGTAGETT